MKHLQIGVSITNRENEIFEKYLVDVQKTRLLSTEEEIDLARKIREGDTDALSELVSSNLRFVISVAKQYQGNGISLHDLISEGNLGLMRAATKFDESRGFKFISYAVWWIRQAMIQAIMEQSKLIRLPANKINEFRKIQKAFTNFEQEFQREPDACELAEIFGFTKEQVDVYFDNKFSFVSTDEQTHSEMKIEDTLSDDEAVGADDLLGESLMKTELEKILAGLKSREAEILISYFGLMNQQSMTLEEIGKKYDITRERVRQIKDQTLERIKKSGNSKNLFNYFA